MTIKKGLNDSQAALIYTILSLSEIHALTDNIMKNDLNKLR